MIVGKLRAIPGVKLAAPEGAFYVLPEMSAFFGPGKFAAFFRTFCAGTSCLFFSHAC